MATPTLCIVLRTDGTCEEVRVDMTALNWEQQLITAGPATIIGVFEAIDTIVLGVDQDAVAINESLKMPIMSLHSLPPPLDDEELIGDAVLFRCDEKMAPLDLSLDEWNEFCMNPSAPKYALTIDEKRRREQADQITGEEELAEDCFDAKANSSS